MVDVFVVVTPGVKIVVPPCVRPAPMLMDGFAGKATDELLVNDTDTPVSLAQAIVAVAVDVLPPVTGFGLSCRVTTVSGLTVMPLPMLVPVAASVAVTVSATLPPTWCEVIWNVADDAP